MMLSLIACATVTHAAAAMLQANAEAEIKTAVHSLYSVISGPAGKARDWDAFRALFADGAHLIVTFQRQGNPSQMSFTPDEYVTRNSPAFETRPFFEREAKAEIKQYGLIAHVWSTYESWSVDPATAGPDDKPFDRGINSIQLVKGEKGWKIQQVVWCAESAGFPLPTDG